MKFLGRRARLCAVLAVTVSLAPAPLLARDDIHRAASKAFAGAQADLQAEDCDGALKRLLPVIERRDFPSLAEPARLQFLMVSVSCELRIRKFQPALTHLQAATAIPGASDEAWRLRFGLELDADKIADATATLETIRQQQPTALAEIETEWIFIANRKLYAAKDDNLRRRFLTVVTSDEFTPARDDMAFDWMRLSYARLLEQDGDKAGAQSQIAAIRSGYTLQEISLDIALRDYLPADFDLRATYVRQLELLQKKGRERPDLLDVPIDMASVYLILGQPEKALATLEAARPEGILSTQFSDRDNRFNWWLNEMASTYAYLGRYDDAVSSMKTAIEFGEHTAPNVSQAINLAALQQQFGRNEDALATLSASAESFKTASPYGVMQYRQAEGCSAHLTGRQAMAEADLDYVRSHEKDDSSALTDLLLCMGRMDEAAASMIRRLDDPESRAKALADLSTFAPPPPNYPESPEQAGLKKLRERPDVKAAIERAGGTRTFNVHPKWL